MLSGVIDITLAIKNYFQYTLSTRNFCLEVTILNSEYCRIVCESYKKHRLSSPVIMFLGNFGFFISHINGVAGIALWCFFLFGRQHSRYQILTEAPPVHHNMKNTLTTFYRNFNLCCSSDHTFPSVTSHNLSHTVDICVTCWRWWATTTRVIIKNLASIMGMFMPVIHLRFFRCSISLSLSLSLCAYCNIVDVYVCDFSSKIKICYLYVAQLQTFLTTARLHAH